MLPNVTATVEDDKVYYNPIVVEEPLLPRNIDYSISAVASTNNTDEQNKLTASVFNAIFDFYKEKYDDLISIYIEPAMWNCLRDENGECAEDENGYITEFYDECIMHIYRDENPEIIVDIKDEPLFKNWFIDSGICIVHYESDMEHCIWFIMDGCHIHKDSVSSDNSISLPGNSGIYETWPSLIYSSGGIVW